jgi:hypothetical protein
MAPPGLFATWVMLDPLALWLIPELLMVVFFEEGTNRLTIARIRPTTPPPPNSQPEFFPSHPFMWLFYHGAAAGAAVNLGGYG